ncbi:sirtuin 6 [Arctopsyche grandis]|uniref:sirtuin 6 n=1 Tax=Arctopsyche grandis TaxID=121162 RepID=UPI00406D7ED9
MSCSYADGLSPYAHKGILGAAEKFDSPQTLKEKCETLTQWIKESKYIVIHTGAGISTSAGIPDFRGPNGVWTLEEKGLKPDINISFNDAKPTATHMALRKLIEDDVIHYVISQNIDGLHLKSGIPRSHMAELHGNMFVDQCNICKRQFVRSSPAPTVGQKSVGKPCHGERSSGRLCRGKLHDTILDWEHSLPDDDLDMADMVTSIADLSICLGTTLQIVPSGNLPLNTLRYGGKLVVCNLQPTKHDNKADLIINSYVDEILQHIMTNLDKKIPEYNREMDPTKSCDIHEWTISKQQLKQTRTLFKKQCDGVSKKRVLVKKSQPVQKSQIKNKKIKKENDVTKVCVKDTLRDCKILPMIDIPKIIKHEIIVDECMDDTNKSESIKENVIKTEIKISNDKVDNFITDVDSKVDTITQNLTNVT